MMAQANREELVERVASLLLPLIDKADRFDKSGEVWGKPYHDGFTVSISLGTCRKVRAAIAELTQAPAEPSDALRSALEDARDYLDAALGDLPHAEGGELLARIDRVLSRPAEPVQGEVTEEMISAGAAAYHGSSPMMIDCDERRDALLVAIYRAMQAAIPAVSRLEEEG